MVAATKAPPLPRAYRSKNHTTIGSNVLALYQALQLPELVLGAEVARKIREIDPQGWYPIAVLLEPLEVIGEAVGPAGLRKVGRKLFQLSHEAHAKQVAHCAKDIIESLDAMYRDANRGEGIGGWRLLHFNSDAEMDDTTPHHCALEEGILDAALRAVGAPCRIEQTMCVRKGAELCRFRVTPATRDARWDRA
jgi:hypothetical protein